VRERREARENVSEISDPLCDQQLIPRSHKCHHHHHFLIRRWLARRGETRTVGNLGFHTIRSPKTNQEQEHHATSRGEQKFEQTDRREIDHEAEGLRVADRELHGIDDGDDDDDDDDDDDIYNFQLGTCQRSQVQRAVPRLNKPLVISLRPTPHEDGRPVQEYLPTTVSRHTVYPTTSCSSVHPDTTIHTSPVILVPPHHALKNQNQSTEKGHHRPLIPPPHFPRTPFPKLEYFQSQPTININITLNITFNFLAFIGFSAEE
jgi:hypothetical protein